MIARATAPLLLAAALVLTACTGPNPDALPTNPEEPTASESPAEEPGGGAEPEEPAATEGPEPVALPTCDTLYSAALADELTDEGRTSEGDTAAAGAGGWGSGDPTMVATLQGAAERVTCTWILPNSSSGSTTTVVRIDEATSASLQTHLVDDAGFTEDTVGTATLYTLSVEGDFPYSEAHLFAEGILIASEYFNGDAEVLTRDAASMLLAP